MGGHYLSEAALAQHHEEVEVRQLDAVSVAVLVTFGHDIGRGTIRVLCAWANFCSLRGEEDKTFGVKEALSGSLPSGG